MFKELVFCGFFFFFAAGILLGATIQLTPEDTYVEDIYPDTNFGKNGSYEVWEFYVGDENYNTPIATTRSYLKFDLSTIPAGSTITSAKIYLRAWGVGPNPSIVVGAYYLDNDSWDQYTITWNNQPTTGHASSPTATNTVNNTAWWDWEVKTDVQDALDADEIYSVVMREATEGTDHNWCGFNSEENDWYPAYMDVTYTPPSNPPVPDIKVNGQDLGFTTPTSTTLNVTVALNPGSQTGVAHDWWVFVTMNSTYTFNFSIGGSWAYGTGPKRCYTGGLFNLNTYTVANSRLPAGTWDFTFAVDALNNTYEGTYKDTITVTTY
jgi:hypothetical protein